MNLAREARPDKKVDSVKVELVYDITLAMCESAISNLRTDIELYKKKLERKQMSLNAAIDTITSAFPHIYFNEQQSCFLRQERVDEKKKEKAQKLRQAMGQEASRLSCDCCLLL